MRPALKTHLENEARGHNTNFNSLTNSILAKHESFDRIVEQGSAVSVDRFLFSAMLDGLESDEMEDIGKRLGPGFIRQTFKFLNLNFDLEGLIHHYFEPFSMYSNWYNLNLVESGHNRRLMFKHGHGRKWSVFLAPYLAGIIKAATAADPTTTIDDGLVTVYPALG
jgi:hypothetical protein